MLSIVILRLILSMIGAAVAAIFVTFAVMLSLFTWAGMTNPPYMDELLVTLLVVLEITTIWYFLQQLNKRRRAEGRTPA